jgi:hypothetical protein
VDSVLNHHDISNAEYYGQKSGFHKLLDKLMLPTEKINYKTVSNITQQNNNYDCCIQGLRRDFFYVVRGYPIESENKFNEEMLDCRKFRIKVLECILLFSKHISNYIMDPKVFEEMKIARESDNRIFLSFCSANQNFQRKVPPKNPPSKNNKEKDNN